MCFNIHSCQYSCLPLLPAPKRWLFSQAVAKSGTGYAGTGTQGPGDACLGKWDTGTRQIGDAWGREIGDACYIAEKRKKYYVVL